MVILLSALCGFLSLVVWFLAKEMLKKFRFIDAFAMNSSHFTVWQYSGDKSNRPGMRNVVLRGQKPFTALVGFRLHIPLLGYTGIDIFGCVFSDEHGVATFSTYLGHGSVDFLFITDTDVDDNPLNIFSTASDQKLVPSVVYPPHFWQRLGFFS